MNAKALILLALQIAIAGTVFTYGLRATYDDLLYIVKRPALLLRSLIAMLVIMPLMVVTCVYFLDLPQPTAVVLLALSVSPVPPLLPQKERKAGGSIAPYGLGLLVVLALVSIITMPLTIAAFNWLFDQPFAVGLTAIIGIVLKMIFAPLAAGIFFSRLMPRVGLRLLRPLRLVATTLLVIGVAALLAGSWRAVWSAIGQSTIVAILVFVLAGFVVGHLLGGPKQEHATVLALATASRHPAIALAVASANYPGEPFAPTLILYLLVCTLMAIPYVKWQRSRRAVYARTS
ncbi:bile acid:sodium symporter family protein [Paraburkholderia flagellata]|uniref:bile acid:sodium symporter family protein n=1 Tax=Paraburkholderia flagellata TaxID=2883241 RepID=UPI001F316562|nr:hypothetical protein [Paraburkholderia flagellata]